MAYSDTLETDLDKARAQLGDTSNDSATELLTDDHIETVLSIYSTFDLALAFMADELAVRFAQEPGSVSLPSGLSVSWSERVKEWRRIADNARSGVLSGTSSMSFVTRTLGIPTTTEEFSRL